MEENTAVNTPTPVITNEKVDTDPWQIETLIRRSFERTKDRFISYFLAVVLSVVIVLAVVLGAVFVAGLLIAISAGLSLSNLGLLSALLIVLMSLLGYLALLYVSSLANLLVNGVVIFEPKVGVTEALSKVRPLVWSFAWLGFLMSLFLGGLFVWGVLSLFVVYILWSIWGAFTTFVFLDKKKGGLASLWISKAMVSQRFWGIVGRLLLLNVAVFFVSTILASSRNSVLELSSVLVSLITQPFLISFSYEMYRNTPETQDVKSPGIWVGLSVVGYVLFFGVALVIGSSIIRLSKSISPQELLNIYKTYNEGRTVDSVIPRSLIPNEYKNYLPENLSPSGGNTDTL